MATIANYCEEKLKLIFIAFYFYPTQSYCNFYASNLRGSLQKFCLIEIFIGFMVIRLYPGMRATKGNPSICAIAKKWKVRESGLSLIFNSRPYISWHKPYNNNLRLIFWVSHFSHATYIMLVWFIILTTLSNFLLPGTEPTSRQSEIPFHGMQLYNRCYGKQGINCQTHTQAKLQAHHASQSVSGINKEKESARAHNVG